MSTSAFRRGTARSAIAVAVAALGLGLTACGPQPGPCVASAVRWASSTNILYVTGEVSCTLSDLDRLTTAPVQRVPGFVTTWQLGANLRLEGGAALLLHGSEVGGDVDELRLRSNNSSAANSTISLRAQWGTFSLRSTRVTSWDDATQAPDTEHATFGRSYIHARSFLDADGTTARESRMDIVDSDVGYLGRYAAESYGLVWKVIGTTPGLYDKVDVLGDVRNSRIHHNYFGMYTYGAYGMRILDNEVDSNVAYGIDPHDDSDALVIERNNVHDNGNHGIICSQRCDNLTIRDNRSERNTGNGLMLHRLVTASLVEGNHLVANTDAGIALFDSSGNTLRDNETRANARGIRLSVGASDNLFQGNDIAANTDYGIYFYKGTDAPASGDGRPRRNRFVNNVVSGSGDYAIEASDTDDNTFTGTTFTANPGGIRFVRSNGNTISGSSLGGLPVQTLGNGGPAPARTALSGFGTVQVGVDAAGSARLFDGAGVVYDPEQALGTTVSSTGSELVLTSATIAASSTVTTRNLRVSTASGRAAVDPVLWESGGLRRKEWTTQATVGTASFTYRVGDLAPNATYRIYEQGVLIGSASADGAGVLTFSDAPGSTAKVRYTVQP